MQKQSFKIDNTLYPLSVLKITQETFEGFDIQFGNGEIVIFDDNPYFIFDEFMNYALSIINEQLPGA